MEGQLIALLSQLAKSRQPKKMKSGGREWDEDGGFEGWEEGMRERKRRKRILEGKEVEVRRNCEGCGGGRGKGHANAKEEEI